MKINAIIALVSMTCFLSSSKLSYCDSGLSYDDTVALIKKTMANNTSSYRQESYGYIKFDRCGLEYEVAGKYPVGSTYNIKYSGIDISSINPRESRVGHDYTAFLILSFKSYLEYNTGSNNLRVKTIVINASDDDATQKLLAAFLHLGQLCNPRGL